MGLKAPTTRKFAFGNGDLALGGQPRIARIGAQTLLDADVVARAALDGENVRPNVA